MSKSVDLPFEYVKYPFEFRSEIRTDRPVYFKFGYSLGDLIPGTSAREPGFYGTYSKFIEDTSLAACRIRRDRLDEERATIIFTIRAWEGLRAEALIEVRKAEEAVKREDSRLYGYAGGAEAVLTSVTGTLKKTQDSQKHWARSQPSYLEAVAWAIHAGAQYQFIDDTYKNLVHNKTKMLMSLATDAREHAKWEHGEVGQ